MLQIKNLTLIHQKDLKTIIENFSCSINPGDKIGIIGEEGNGKSALLKCIAQQKEIDTYLSVTGQIINQFKHTAYLPQFVDEPFQSLTIYDYFTQNIDINDIDYPYLYKLLSELQLDSKLPFSDQIITTLSGGEKIKIQLLKLLLEHPDLLLLDEPTNDLDIQSVLWLEKFIKNTEITVIFVSHDVTLLRNVTTGIIHIERLIHKTKPRTTFSHLPYTLYMQERQQHFNHESQIAQNQRNEDKKRMRELNRIQSSVRHQLLQAHDATAGRLLAKKMKSVKSQEKRFERERNKFTEIPLQEETIDIRFNNILPLPNGKQLINLENFTLSLKGNPLIKSINFRMVAGEKIGIVGKNGIGKTTLINAIIQTMPPFSSLSIGYMAQNYEEVLNSGLSALEFILQDGDTDERTRLMTYLGSLNFLPDEMLRPMNQLSGGQKVKLLFAKFDFNKNNFLILDEPTRNISPASMAAIIAIFKNYPGSILAVSHDRLFLKEVCDKVYELTKEGLSEITI